MNHRQNPVKLWIIIVLLLASVIVAYTMPIMHYAGTGFISKLEIPLTINNWHGKDVTNELNLDFDKNWNKFISGAKINQYINKDGNKLLFIILDAGNFHHPNVCFTSSGYEIQELSDTEFTIQDRTIKTHTLFTTKGEESNLSFYWIIIDKKIVQNWIEQKLKQLYFSLFNRERVGLMVRVDIPAKKENVQDAIILAKQFVIDLSSRLPKEQAAYIFGDK